MKQGMHPNYDATVYVCSCGNRFESKSTKGGELHLELCDQCHPFYTGQQKFVDTGGRVQRFADKFGAAAIAALEKDAKKVEERREAAEAAEAAKKAERDAKAAAKAAKAAKYDTAPAPVATEEVVVEEAPAEAPVEETVEAPAEESAE